MALAGDTTFGGENASGRWDLRNTAVNPYLDMNSFTVTKVGSNMVGLTSVAVLDPGHINVQEGTFRTESATVLNGSAANTMTVQNNAVFEIYSLPNPILWSLVMNDGARFGAANGNGMAQNVWAGPITLNGYSRFDPANGYSMTLAGDISGAGSLVKINAGTTYLTGTNNTYGGGTFVSNSWLYAYNPGSLPDYATPGKVQVASGATLALFGGNGTSGWTGEQLNALHSGGAFLASNSVMAVDTTYADVTGLGGMSGFALYKYGTNILTVTGVNTNRAAPSGEHSNLRVYAGTLTLSSSSSNVYGRCYVLPGTIGATLEINGPTTFTDEFYVGNGNGDRSRVIINTNVWANRAWVGRNQIANGALIQNAGIFEVAPNTGGTQVFEIGRDGAYGYYRLNGGNLRTGQFAIGGGSGSALTGNNGVFEQFGGTVDVTGNGGWVIWGWVGGNGVANMYDGTLVAPYTGNNVNMAHTQDRGSFAMLNLLGPGAFLHTVSNSTSRILNLANSSGNLQSVVNLNAGVILANRVSALNTGTPSFLNFGGGTLRANGSTSLASTFLQGLTAATVYPGGAVIDTTNIAITVNQPLLAPTGYGIVSIPVTFSGAGYIGPPVVMISGGSGTGATAIATVDVNASSPTYGLVTGITVTSPGSGYQFGDIPTVTLLRGGYTMIAQAGAPVMAPNQAVGGLTKTGSGILTLGGINTYGGATVISGGVLKLGNALALQTGTEVVLAGGSLDLNGFTVTNAISGSGTVSNGTVVTVISPAGAGVIGTSTVSMKSASLQGTYRADVTANGASDHLTIQGSVNLSGLSLEIVDPDQLNRSKVYTIATVTGTPTGTLAVANLPDRRWHLFTGSDGKIKLVFVDGTLIYLR
jgi:autotransporter-associated beta strand protein